MSAFKNGDIVKTKTDIYGRVQPYKPELHPTYTAEEFGIPEETEYREQTPTKLPGKSGLPGSEMDEPVLIRKGQIGEVLYSDELDTIAMFPIHETKRLEPHLVKAQGFTKDFQRVVRKNPPEVNRQGYEKPRSPFNLEPGGRLKKNPQRPLQEPDKSIMGEIIDVSPTIKPFSKWKISAGAKEQLASDYASKHPFGDPFEWGGGHGPHGDIIAKQEDDWWNQPEDQQKLAVMNALRVAILSPMKLLKHNAIHYQDFADMDPYENDEDAYLARKRTLTQKWNNPGQIDLFGERADANYEEEMPPYDERYAGIINEHLKSIAKLGNYVDQLHAAAIEDLKHGGTGKIWRDALRDINVPGVNDKVSSFSWLLLAPKTSQLATIDVHMSDAMGVAQPNKPQEYETYEQMMDATRKHMGYEDMPLGAFQWGLWDYYRTGPGSHQAHDAMKPLNYTPYSEIDWSPSAERKQLPPGFEESKPLRDKILQESGISIRENEKQKKKKKNENQLEMFSKWRIK